MENCAPCIHFLSFDYFFNIFNSLGVSPSMRLEENGGIQQ